MGIGLREGEIGPVEKVRQHLARYGLEDRLLELPADTSTAPSAARALGVGVGEIAKTLCLVGNRGAAIVVAPGDARISQSKFKAVLGWTGKVSLASPEETARLTGFPVGGVCPFALPEGLPVLLDAGLRQYGVVYPAAGSTNSAVRLTPQELERATGGTWCDLAKEDDSEDGHAYESRAMNGDPRLPHHRARSEEGA